MEHDSNVMHRDSFVILRLLIHSCFSIIFLGTLNRLIDLTSFMYHVLSQQEVKCLSVHEQDHQLINSF